MTQALGQPRPRQGEIWRVRLDDDPDTPRPAVVVSNNEINDGDFIIVVPTSTSLADIANEHYHVLLPKGEGGLPKECHARAEMVAAIWITRFIEKIGGPIQLKYFHAITAGVRRSMGDFNDWNTIYKDYMRLKKRLDNE